MEPQKTWWAGAVAAGLLACSMARSQESGLPAPGAEEPEPAATLVADLGLNSRYMFWGLTLSNKPVWQPDLYLTTHGLTFGVWANFEFSRQSASSGSDYTTGGDRSGNTEIDYSVEYAHGVGSADGKFGVVRWTYDRDNTGSLAPYATQDLFPGLRNGPDIDSTEIYATLSWGKAPFSPNVSLYYDIDIYRGLYGSVSASKSFAAGSKNITTQLLVGFSTGESNTGRRDIPLYSKEGLTHIDLSASLPLEVGATSITPNLHLQYNIDDATKITGFDNRTGEYKSDDWVVTVGVSFGWVKGFGGR